MYLYANSIEGNANATAGMFLYDVIECHIEAGVIKKPYCSQWRYAE